MSDDLLKAISLSELYIIVILFSITCITKKVYILLILIGLFSKHIPEQIIKRSSGYYQLEISKRPEGANNCNMLNSGGPALSPGTISGHVFNLSTLIFLLIFIFTDKGRPMTLNESIMIVLMFVLLASLIYARIGLRCHTPVQTFIGFIFGAAWGYGIYKVLNLICDNYPDASDGKKRMLNAINDCNIENFFI